MCTTFDPAMEGGIQRQASGERRIRARAAKLLAREITYAQTRGLPKIKCPCNLHVRCRRSFLNISSYRRCVIRNDRHPWFFGSAEVREYHFYFVHFHFISCSTGSIRECLSHIVHYCKEIRSSTSCVVLRVDKFRVELLRRRLFVVHLLTVSLFSLVSVTSPAGIHPYVSSQIWN